MANTKSSKKDLRRSAKKRTVNLSVRSGLKTHVKNARTAISNGSGSAESIVQAMSALDKAVQRGIIHKNQAARRKSRLAKLARGTAAASAQSSSAQPKAQAAEKPAKGKGIKKKKE